MKKDVLVKTELLRCTKDFKITYLDENDYRKKCKGLKRVNMLAYKQICHNLLKNNEFSKKPGKHEIILNTNEDFRKIHGDIKLIYSTIGDTILIEDLIPGKVLLEYHNKAKNVYKGIPFVDEKDIFKINLLKELKL